jgi:hypothetical protein
MVAHVEVVSGQQRRWRIDRRRFPDLLVVAEWGGVLEQRRWRQWSLETDADDKGDDGEGVPTAAACEGNKILPSDFRRKGESQFIGSSISSGSTWNRC